MIPLILHNLILIERLYTIHPLVSLLTIIISLSHHQIVLQIQLGRTMNQERDLDSLLLAQFVPV